jgi:hypothetical protein
MRPDVGGPEPEKTPFKQIKMREPERDERVDDRTSSMCDRFNLRTPMTMLAEQFLLDLGPRASEAFQAWTRHDATSHLPQRDGGTIIAPYQNRPATAAGFSLTLHPADFTRRSRLPLVRHLLRLGFADLILL